MNTFIISDPLLLRLMLPQLTANSYSFIPPANRSLAAQLPLLLVGIFYVWNGDSFTFTPVCVCMCVCVCVCMTMCECVFVLL